MDKATFTDLLSKVSVSAREFAARYVTNHLPDLCRYFVHLSESFDGNPLKPGEQVFPADADRYGERIGPLTASAVVDLLWRDTFIPEWIDICVAEADSEHTFFELRCCGRFAAEDSLLYFSERGQGPFGVKSPTFPRGCSEQVGRFDLPSRER